jgi:hypothetical protein
MNNQRCTNRAPTSVHVVTLSHTIGRVRCAAGVVDTDRLVDPLENALGDLSALAAGRFLPAPLPTRLDAALGPPGSWAAAGLPAPTAPTAVAVVPRAAPQFVYPGSPTKVDPVLRGVVVSAKPPPGLMWTQPR